MAACTHSYAELLSLTWSVECMANFLNTWDLARLCSGCAVLDNARGEYARAASRVQHGYARYDHSCLAALNHLKMLECIPRACVVNEMESLESSWTMRISLRRGRYCLIVYSRTYKFHEQLEITNSW